MQRKERLSHGKVSAMSPDEFEEWVFARPDTDLNHYELLDGEIVMSPPAGWPHGKVGGSLQFLLQTFVRAKALGTVFDSSQGFVLPSGDVVEPDHSFVSNERWAAAPDPVDGKFLRIVPDLIVEVLAKSTAGRDRTKKLRAYEKNGVREYWIVDNKKRAITVYVLDEGAYGAGHVFREGEGFESHAITGMGIEVGEVFA